VPLTPLDLLSSVEAAFFSAHRSTLHRLGIDHSGAGLRISLQAYSKAFSEGPIDTLPSPVHAPLSEVPVNGGPPGKVVRQQAPLASALQEVEDGVEDLTQTVGPWVSVSFGSGHVGFYVFPFGVG
jgi:hypothetical protein